MDLKVKDVAKLLDLSEKTIYRMIQSETIPCIKLGGQWRFNKEELLTCFTDAKDASIAWKREISPVIREEKVSLPELLKSGGIYYRVSGNSKEQTITEAINLVEIGSSQKMITAQINATLEREELCSTAIGNGIALPHSIAFPSFSNHIPSISLIFLEKSISFGGLEGEDVRILFFISTGCQLRYLRLRAKLISGLRKENVCAKLKKVPLRKEIYELFS